MSAKAAQKPQYEALWQQKENRFATRKAEIKQLYKPQWSQLYKDQRAALRLFDTDFMTRLKFGAGKHGAIMGFTRALISEQGLRHEFLKEQEKARTALSQAQRRTIYDASREITKAWQYDRDQLKAQHSQQRQARYDQAKDLSGQIWEQGKSASNETAPQQEQTPEQDNSKKKFLDQMRSKRNKARGRTRKPR